MAKGFKLKELLTHQKQIAKEDRKNEQKSKQQKEVLKKDEPTVVTSSDVEKSKKAKKAPKAEPAKVEEEYQSNALSKKDKRKLKKELNKISKVEKEEAPAKLEKEESDEEEEEEEENELDLERLARSDSDESESESEEEDDDKEEQDENEDDEEEEDVALSDVEFDSDADIVPHHKLSVNNPKAMKHSLERVQLPWAKHSFQEHQSITSTSNTDEGIKDIYDDTERELAFYKQSLEAVKIARDEFKKLRIPFERPLDYFAEMVKNDEHMDKIKGKLVQEASEKKAREDARKQRQLKKFGKQVQVATLQKRQLEKRETLEKIKSLKKKRKSSEIDTKDFDVGIEEATEDFGGKNNKRMKPNGKRQAKNDKYGFGGMKRYKRKNDADSTNDVSGFSSRRTGKKARPGKSRRKH